MSLPFDQRSWRKQIRNSSTFLTTLRYLQLFLSKLSEPQWFLDYGCCFLFLENLCPLCWSSLPSHCLCLLQEQLSFWVPPPKVAFPHQCWSPSEVLLRCGAAFRRGLSHCWKATSTRGTDLLPSGPGVLGAERWFHGYVLSVELSMWGRVR